MEIKRTLRMFRLILLLFILITLSIFPTESRRLKRVGKSVVEPEVEENVVKPTNDVENSAVADGEDVEVREEEEIEEEVLSEDEQDAESLPDEDVNILIPIADFRKLMADEIAEGREALAVQATSACSSGHVKDVLQASSTYTATVFDVLDHSWHRIKYFRSRMKDSTYRSEVLDEIAILAGGSGGRRELSTMSDLELMAIVPEPSYDKLVSSLFIKEAGQVNIHIDTVNKPMRKFKGSIASTVKELVHNVFLSRGGNSMNEVLVSMLLEASVVAGKYEVEDTLKRELHTLMRTPIDKVDSKSFQRFVSTFMKSSSGLVDPKKPFYFGDFIQWKMENWKLRNAVGNMKVLKEIASGKRREFDIKKHLYRGLQTSIQLLSYYTLSREMKEMETTGGASVGSGGGGSLSTNGASAAVGAEEGEEDEALMTPKRKIRGIVASKTLKTLAFCACNERFEKCMASDELQTIVALRIAAHNYYGAENDNVKLPSLSSRAEVLSRETSMPKLVEEEEEVGMMGAESAPYEIPMSMLPHVYDAIVVSGALQETWIEISNTLQKVLNDRDDFITVFSSEFEKKLEVWKKYVSALV